MREPDPQPKRLSEMIPPSQAIWDLGLELEIRRFFGADLPEVPRCQFVQETPWGRSQCALPEGHEDDHLFSPSEGPLGGDDGRGPLSAC